MTSFVRLQRRITAQYEYSTAEKINHTSFSGIVSEVGDSQEFQPGVLGIPRNSGNTRNSRNSGNGNTKSVRIIYL